MRKSDSKADRKWFSAEFRGEKRTPNQGSVVVNTESEFFSQALWQKTSPYWQIRENWIRRPSKTSPCWRIIENWIRCLSLRMTPVYNSGGNFNRIQDYLVTTTFPIPVGAWYYFNTCVYEKLLGTNGPFHTPSQWVVSARGLDWSQKVPCAKKILQVGMIFRMENIVIV